MKICIYGAGAIGGFVAAMMARAGHEVSVVARGEHLAAIRARGLTLEYQGDRFTLPVAATDDPATLGTQDYVVLSVKAPALPEVARRMTPLLGTETAVITAQNGIPWWFFHDFGPRPGLRLRAVDPDGALAQAVPPERVIGCVLHIGASVPEPGVIRHASQNRFLIGEPSGRTTARTERLIDALSAAGIGAIHHPDIQQQYWIKLLGNMPYAPISLMTGATNDQLGGDPAVRPVMIRMIEEAVAAGRYFGLEPGMTPDERIDLGATLVGFKTSMRQDFERGRPVELDTIVRSVIEMGEIAGVETPTIRTVFALAAQHARLAGVYGTEAEALAVDASRSV